MARKKFNLASLFNLNVFFSGSYASKLELMPGKKPRATFPLRFRDTLKARQNKDDIKQCTCSMTPGDFPVLAVMKDYVSENEAPAYDSIFFRDERNPGRFSFPFDIPRVKNVYFIGYRDRVEVVSMDSLPKSYNSSTS